MVKNFFKNSLRFLILVVHTFLFYNCNESCTDHSFNSLSDMQKADEELKSSAIEGLKSIYFIGPGKVNPEILTLLNYGSGKAGKEYMKDSYKTMEKEIKTSQYINEKKSTNPKGEEYIVKEYATNDMSYYRSGEPCNYLFYYNSTGKCIGFVKYFKNYNLDDSSGNSIITRISQNRSYSDINNNNFGYVDLLAVEQSERTKGAAKILMNYCEDKLKEEGKKFCILYTFDEKSILNKEENQEYTTAHTFYEKLEYGNGLAGNPSNGNKTTYMVKRL